MKTSDSTATERLKLISAIAGSCTCMTRIPDIKYHNQQCNYRLLMELFDALDETINRPERSVEVPSYLETSEEFINWVNTFSTLTLMTNPIEVDKLKDECVRELFQQFEDKQESDI